MSRVAELNLPPEEIYRKIWGTRKNVEHIILWLLKNNEVVEWADFLDEPISIPQSTLSNYLKALFLDGYIEKERRGEYRITGKGEDRFNELSRARAGERNLNYPPKVISEKRNYDHIILWMSYNNNYLKWSDFLDDKASVFINQSALSKNINILLKKELVRKDDNKEYRITQAGKAEYARILKLYDLDRQSILNEESKRIEEITRKTIRFFEDYNVVNSDVKFRFLNNVLMLPFEILKGSLDTEYDFNKLLFYLSMNHPNQYPAYISARDFSKKYGIDKLDLEFNIRKIIEKNVYSLKFFKLEVDEDKTYYFQANEKLEKVLRAITEDYITKFTYLNKLYEKTSNGTPSLTLESTVNVIVNEICESMFHSDLKETLSKFLPGYINYLAYKMEKQTKLDDITDKLEGSIWRDFQYYSAASEPAKTYDENQENYYISPMIFEILDDYSVTPDISPIVEETKKLLKSKPSYKRALEDVNSSISKGLDNVEMKLFKSRVLCHVNKYVEALDLLENEIDYEKYADDENIYLSASFIVAFAYTALGNAKKALKIIERIQDDHPDHPIPLAAKALIYGHSFIYEFDVGEKSDDYVLDLIDEVIRIDSNISNKARYYYFKATVLEQMEKPEDALEEIEIGLDLTEDIIDLHYHRSKILSSLERYEEAFAVLEETEKHFPDSRKHLLMQKAYIHKIAGDLESGLDIVTELTEKYPEDVDYFNNKAYWHVYIYKMKKEDNIEDEENKKAAIETIKYLTEEVPDEGNYHDSYGEILMITGDYENAIKKYEQAIKIEPNGWFIPSSHVGLGKCFEKLGMYDEAKAHFLEAKKIVRYCFCHIKQKKEWVEDIEYHLKKLNELEDE
ncbi:MAG: tetratricopeptide repeat protein [Promethearchaeota archaeon]|jgi:tetratricopeptide (TPR) repeat protein/DNA-binding PadR family transcriptional regulator